MQRRLAMIVLAAVAATVLLVSVTTSGEVHFWHAAKDSTAVDEVVVPPPVTATANTVPPLKNPDPSKDAGLPRWLARLFQLMVVISALALVIGAVSAVWRLRPRGRRRQLAGTGAADAVIDMSRIIADDAIEQRAALLDGAPRNAIVACWLRLESTVAAAGLQRDDAETSTEFTTRLLASYSLDAQAVDRLAALYREARFSDHAMGETDREAAVAALDAIHESLRANADMAAIG